MIASNEYNLTTFFDQHNRYLGRPADRLRVKHWWGDHVGSLNWDGRVWAASRAYRGIRLVNLNAFTGGGSLINEGHIGINSRSRVLESYAALESEGYCVLTKNCEHIDNFVRGLGYRSPQIDIALMLGGAFALIAATQKK